MVGFVVSARRLALASGRSNESQTRHAGPLMVRCSPWHVVLKPVRPRLCKRIER